MADPARHSCTACARLPWAGAAGRRRGPRSRGWCSGCPRLQRPGVTCGRTRAPPPRPGAGTSQPAGTRARTGGAVEDPEPRQAVAAVHGPGQKHGTAWSLQPAGQDLAGNSSVAAPAPSPAPQPQRSRCLPRPRCGSRSRGKPGPVLGAPARQGARCGFTGTCSGRWAAPATLEPAGSLVQRPRRSCRHAVVSTASTSLAGKSGFSVY